MERDVLWLGLHKTGTTFLQKSLDQSQEPLRSAGICWVPLDEFRAKWTRPLLQKQPHGTAPAPPDLPPDLSPDPANGRRHRLIFDENIIGLVQNGVTEQGLYPMAGQRTLRIARHLRLERPQLVLGLRGFVGFLPSLYCEALKATPFQPFRTFLRWPIEAMSWLPLIRQLLAAFPESELLLYRAEDLRGHEALLLAHLTGLQFSDFVLLGAPERVGQSHEAILRLHQMAERQPIAQNELRRMTQLFPRSPERGGFMPWDAAERALLDALYDRDIVHLCAQSRTPGTRLRLLDLPALAAATVAA